MQLRSLWWADLIRQQEDVLDHGRRARLAAGIGAILVVVFALDITAGILVHGLSRITVLLMAGLALSAVSWWLSRRGYPTQAAVVLGSMVAVVVLVGAYLSDAVSTWPIAVPVTVLILVFMLPLRWAPAVLASGLLELVALAVLSRGFGIDSLTGGELIRDMTVVTTATVAIGLYGALSLAAAQRARHRALDEASIAAHLAGHDPLTGLPNRRVEEVALPDQARDLGAAGDLLAIAMIDVDQFKAVNDTLGHDAGDFVLREIATVTSQETRRSDTLVRHGGDEFLLAMPRATRTEAAVLCERLRLIVEHHDWSGRLGQLPNPTVSIGVADTSEHPEWAALVNAADRRLLEAKGRGRNCVISEG